MGKTKWFLILFPPLSSDSSQIDVFSLIRHPGVRLVNPGSLHRSVPLKGKWHPRGHTWCHTEVLLNSYQNCIFLEWKLCPSSLKDIHSEIKRNLSTCCFYQAPLRRNNQNVILFGSPLLLQNVLHCGVFPPPLNSLFNTSLYFCAYCLEIDASRIHLRFKTVPNQQADAHRQ